jgi:hypothetical protein
MSQAGVRAPQDPRDIELEQYERASKMKQAKLRALMYAKYLTMYGGDPATMQGILGSEGGYGGYRSGPGPRAGGG